MLLLPLTVMLMAIKKRICRPKAPLSDMSFLPMLASLGSLFCLFNVELGF